MAVQIRRKVSQGGAPPPHMTYEEFLNWADEDTLAEWVDGKVEFMSPASSRHQNISGFLAALLRAYVEDHEAGQVFAAPFQMRLAELKRGREPDLLFVAKGHLSRLKATYLDGPADLAVEIISPESVLRDRGTKYGEYEAGGVREYWIVDLDAQRADFFLLGDDGRYERQRPNADGAYYSPVLTGFWINTGWLWQEPTPTLRAVLKDWEAKP
jgi:Uma2 family endonuclease